MTIKIVLTGVDAMDWMKTLANIAGTKPLYAEAGIAETVSVAPGTLPEQNAIVIEPPKRTRRTSAQVAADFKAREAAEYAALQAQAALPNDPLADIGTIEAVADADPLDLGSDGQSSPAIADDLDLGDK